MDSTLTLFLLFWALPGYIGAFMLMLKGYTLELIGCAILAGGLPLLLPAVVGPIFAAAAYALPDKNKR